MTPPVVVGGERPDLPDASQGEGSSISTSASVLKLIAAQNGHGRGKPRKAPTPPSQG